MHRVPVDRVCFPPAEREAIQDLACQSPSRVGWKATHWSQRIGMPLRGKPMAQAAGELEYVDSIHQTTVRAILSEADLQPDRFRYWKTTVWDDEAVERALKILWYYERIDHFWRRGEVILCGDEKPNLQVLERKRPIRLMRPGHIELQEFEYIRHGTVILLAGLTVYNGRMWAECLDKNDGEHFRPALCRWLHPYGWANRIHVILDNWASHVSAETAAFLQSLSPRLHVLFTPVNASWLNQAESLLEAFSTRYFLRGSWNSRGHMVQHISDSRADYNQRFAHRFHWDWSCRDFLYWLNNTPGLIRCKT